MQREITYLSKDVEFYEVNESNVGKLYKSHFKPPYDIKLTTKEDESRRRKILNRECEYEGFSETFGKVN